MNSTRFTQCVSVDSVSSAKLAQLETVQDAETGEVNFYGSREAFTRSDLIPSGLAFPGDMPGMKGARWSGLDGKRYKLIKWPGGFRFSVRLSKEQETRHRSELERKRRLDKIDKELAALNKPASAFRAEMTKIMLLGFDACRSQLTSGYGWRYEPHVIEQVTRCMDEAREHLRTGAVQRNQHEVNDVERSRAAVADSGLQRFLCEVAK